VPATEQNKLTISYCKTATPTKTVVLEFDICLKPSLSRLCSVYTTTSKIYFWRAMENGMV